MRKNNLTKKNKNLNNEDEVYEMEEIGIDEAMEFLFGSYQNGTYVVRDEKGEVVVDEDVIKVVHDAMRGREFEFGGEFKNIFKERSKKRHKNV